MKPFFVLLILLSAASMVKGQVLLTEEFTAPTGTLLTASGWTQSGSTSTNPLAIGLPGGLVYAGYPSSGIGNAVPLTTSGQDVFRSFAPCSSGSLFLSFMLSVSAAQSGDYFVALSPGTHQTNYFARLHIKSSGSGYVLGLSKNTEAAGGAVYGTTVFPFGATALVVVKYTFSPADTADDAVSVYAFAGAGIPSLEPLTPEVGPYTSTRPDAPDLGIITLRQGAASAAPTLVIDGIRVATGWSDAPLPVELENLTAIPLSEGAGIRIEWSTLSEVNVYGFEVQKGVNRSGPYLPASGLIAAQGTSSLPHEYTFVDRTDVKRLTCYRIKVIDLDGATYFSEPVEVRYMAGVAKGDAEGFELRQNYPNPFNPSTVVSYRLASGSLVTLAVFDVLGRRVSTLVNGYQGPGLHTVRFDAKGIAAGIYYCRLVASGHIARKTMLLLR